ncbi:hypothetical protein EDD21DRAFT_64345 [Dissophora ornata]|nr:hypothetical protein EDD21DRAFT_64345 [Dissophora ornata]
MRAATQEAAMPSLTDVFVLSFSLTLLLGPHSMSFVSRTPSLSRFSLDDFILTFEWLNSFGRREWLQHCTLTGTPTVD